MENQNGVQEPEVLSPDANQPSQLAVIERATIDGQIATAHVYPRSMAVFKRKAMEMVCLDEETAQSCIFRRPVGRKPDGSPEYAEGKSIRMAEIVAACYGNIRVGAQIVEMTPRFVRARGSAHDLESNFAATSEVVESTVTKNGQPYSERMRVVIAKACLSKARRDATFMVVPGALCKSLEEAARTTAIGTAATLGKRRTMVVDWINKLGIEASRVFAALGVKGIDDVGLEQLEELTGIRTAIKDGETTLDEAFPRPGQEERKETDTAAAQSLKDRVTTTQAPATSAAPAGEATEKPAPTTQPPKDKPAQTGEADTLNDQIKPLYDALTAKKVNNAMKAAGINISEGEEWEFASVEKRTALLSLLKAAK